MDRLGKVTLACAALAVVAEVLWAGYMAADGHRGVAPLDGPETGLAVVQVVVWLWAIASVAVWAAAAGYFTALARRLSGGPQGLRWLAWGVAVATAAKAALQVEQGWMALALPSRNAALGLVTAQGLLDMDRLRAFNAVWVPIQVTTAWALRATLLGFYGVVWRRQGARSSRLKRAAGLALGLQALAIAVRLAAPLFPPPQAPPSPLEIAAAVGAHYVEVPDHWPGPGVDWVQFAMAVLPLLALAVYLWGRQPRRRASAGG